MNTADREMLIEVQDLLLDLLKDATAAVHHARAEVGLVFMRELTSRKYPNLQTFEDWRKTKENGVRGNPKLEAMVYAGLFPGRVHGLLAELVS